VDAVKLVARAHQTAIWERTRQVLRMRSTLLEYFPAAVEAFEDLSAKDSLLLLARAPSPARVGKLTRSQVVSALRAARRHHVEAKADALLAVLRAPGLQQPAITEAAYAAVVLGQVGIITALNEQIAQLEKVVDEHFGRHPAADIYLGQPGLGVVLAARVLGEFGDDKKRFSDVRARKNYSGQSPITRASGRKTIVMARYATNRRLGAALQSAGVLRTHCFAGCTGLLRRAQGPGRSVITLRCASSRTGSSASCTAASRPAPDTMKTPLGSTKTSLPLDTNGMGCLSAQTHGR